MKQQQHQDNASSLDDSTLASAIGNGEDLGTLIRAAFEIGKPEALLGQLRSFVKRKEAEIEELCRVHYEEFIRAVDELRNVLVDAEILKNQLWQENGDMQTVGRALLSKLEQLIEWHGVRSNLATALASLKACTSCVALYARVNSKLDADELYAALKALDTVERDYMPQLPAASLCASLESHMPLVRSYIEKKVLHEFNDWLVDIRGVAKQIGQHAMAKASLARQREGQLRTRQRAAEEQSRSTDAAASAADGIYVLLDLDDDDGDGDDGDGSAVVELTAVYRAHYIHACLGLGGQFRDYYFDNRRLQLMSDLHVPPGSFLECHQAFLAQLAGFFIVEDHVLRTSGGLVDAAQVESLWELALTRLCGVVEEQLSRMAAANHMLVVKDSASLLVATLGTYGYSCGPLLDTLGRARERYHELLLSDCGHQVSEVLANDKFEQMLLRKEYEYGMNVLAFQLQPSESSPTPAFPFVAPFSASVPACCRIVRDFASDSASFLFSAGHTATRDADAVAGYVDKVVVGCVNEAMAKLVRSPTLGMSQAMQLAANLTVLEQRACDFWAGHVARLCGIPPRLASSLSASRLALRQTQAGAQERMLELVKSKIDDFMLLTAHIDWTPEQPPQHGNAYLNEVVIYLETLAPSAAAILPSHAFDRWTRGLLSHISDCILASLAADDVRRFNTNAILGIDTDLRVLESFAHEHSSKNSSSNNDLRTCLAPARQLVNLLLSNQPDLYLNPVFRDKSYNALDAAQLLVIAEKYRDLPDKTLFSRGLGARGGAAAAATAKKKPHFDNLIKRLREFA